MSDEINFPEVLRQKVATFRERRLELSGPTHKEASTRVEFVDHFLTSLGWDVSNSAGLPERFKEVVVEPSQDVDGHKRAPDYALRVDGVSKMFVEAKKPSVYLKMQVEPAYQVRRYAWSAQQPIALLTNFSEFAIYDGRVKPNLSDPARKARLMYFKSDELEARWPEIVSLIGREAVRAGSLDAFVSTLSGRSGAERIDRVFLKDLEEARSLLLAHVAEKNPALTDSELLRSIQLTLDRIIFLRICEDRLVEPFGSLRAAAESENPRAALNALYMAADSRYNSGLFHFEVETGRVEPDVLTPSLNIDDSVVRETILRFYPPVSPYAFGLMPVEVLGKAYESFLSQRITRAGGKVALELKPEVRKAGGVYYTPEWLTSEVLEVTLAPLLEGKTPQSFNSRKRLRVLDPACGSGSFLVQAYRHLLDWHLRFYAADAERWLGAKKPPLERNKLGEIVLALPERKRILLDHIFGVDVDEQAVEVAKLSLLLTVMEDQDASDVAQQLAIFKDRILPDLDENVRCGNSLIAPDILSDDELADVFSPRRAKINPFDWRGFGGEFSAIVGNPPWLMAGYEIEGEALAYLKRKYDSYTGKADLYYLFVEKSLELLEDGGRFGLVVPNKMFSTTAASGLRKVLARKPRVERIIDFQAAQLFEGATNYTQVLVASKQSIGAADVITYVRSTGDLSVQQSWSVPRSRLSAEEWDLSSPEAAALWDRVAAQGTKLRDIADGFGNGVQTGKDPLLILTGEQIEGLKIEQRYTRPLLRGQDIRDGDLARSSKFVVLPYEERAGEFRVLTDSELSRAPWLEAYLHANESALRARRWFGKSAFELTGQWWGMMYLDAASAFAGKHLLTPSLSGKANFALGDGRLFPTGTAGVTSVELPTDYDERALLAILNSRLMSTFAMAHSPYYQGGYHKFSKVHIENLPIKVPVSPSEVAIWDRLAGLWDTRMKLAPGRERRVVDNRIDDVVSEYYGVSHSELDPVVRQVEPLTSDH